MAGVMPSITTQNPTSATALGGTTGPLTSTPITMFGSKVLIGNASGKGGLAPILLLAAAAVGGWFLWRKFRHWGK